MSSTGVGANSDFEVIVQINDDLEVFYYEEGAAAAEAKAAAAEAREAAQEMSGSVAAISTALQPGAAASNIAYGGRTLTQVLDQLLYSGLSITAMTVTPSQIEQGATANVTVAWAVSGTVTGQTLAGVAVPAANRSKSFTGVSVTTVYDLIVQDASAPTGAVQTSRSATVNVLPRRFWGVADAPTLDSAGVNALAGSELSAARARSVSADGGTTGRYVYYAYPASLGDPATYRIYGFDETPVKSTVTVTTAAGAILSYIVLRSPNKLTGLVPVEIS